MIIKIGGTNGSGKTTLMREVLSRWKFTPVPHEEGREKIREYVATEDVPAPFTKIVVLGDYRNVCGGMDTVTDKFVVREMVRRYSRARKTLVFFEGLITGKTYGELGAYSDEKNAVPWLYAFMDTPFEVCVSRVLARRRERGAEVAFDPERTMRPTYNACASTARRAREAGHAVYMVNHTDTPKKAVNRLLKAVLK